MFNGFFAPKSVEEVVEWIAADPTLGPFAYQAQDAWDHRQKGRNEFGQSYSGIYENTIDEIDLAMERRGFSKELRDETLAHVKLHGAKLPSDVAWSKHMEETSTRRPRAPKPAKPKKTVRRS